MEITNLISIQCLPENVFELIAEYLTSDDLNTCYNVCLTWRHHFNKNKLWKKCCIYPEEYYTNHDSKYFDNLYENNVKCIWRQYYEYQEHVCDNFSKGKYIIEKSDISISQINFFYRNVDDHGQHWLFDINNNINKFTVYKLTNNFIFHQEVDEVDDMEQIWPLKNMVLTCCSNYLKVFLFKHPEYELKLLYRFQFEMEDVLPENAVITADNYSPGIRFICVGNLFVGCNENVTNLRESLLHFWDLNSSKKITTKSVHQPTFADFVKLKSGRSIDYNFKGGLLLFESNEKQFLLTLIDDSLKLCQVTLFDIDSMSFSNVIAQLESSTAWCSMKENIVAIYHCRNISSQISVYDVKGVFLTKLDLLNNYNPMFSDEFWFSGSHIFLIVDGTVEIISITSGNKVEARSFQIGNDNAIFTLFPPKFLLLYDKSVKNSLSITAWDVEKGVKLWNLPELELSYNCRYSLKNATFPFRLLVNLKNDNNFSILSFEDIGI